MLISVFKVILLIVYRSRSSSISAAWFSAHRSLESNDGAQRRGELRGQIEAPYRDEPLLENDDQSASSSANGRATNHTVDRTPVVQPSRLHDEGSEWRDEA